MIDAPSAPCMAYFLVRAHVPENYQSPDVGMTLSVTSNMDRLTSVWELSGEMARSICMRLGILAGVSVQLAPYDRGALEAG